MSISIIHTLMNVRLLRILKPTPSFRKSSNIAYGRVSIMNDKEIVNSMMVICFSFDWLAVVKLGSGKERTDLADFVDRLRLFFAESLRFSKFSSSINDPFLCKLDLVVMLFLELAALYRARIITRFRVIPSKLGTQEPNIDLNHGNTYV